MTSKVKNESKMQTLQTDFIVKTSGTGLWSNIARDVKIIKLEWNVEHEDEGSETFVRVVFDPTTWNTEKDGLIYTDVPFQNELRIELLKLQAVGQLPNLPWSDISYTEQGMQGDDYVDMILGQW